MNSKNYILTESERYKKPKEHILTCRGDDIMTTNMKQITIRPETHKDYKDIVSLVLRSFKEGTDYSDGTDIVALIEEIRDSEYYIPELAFVAELDGEIVGHFLFSYFPLSETAEGGHGGAKDTDIVILAPVSVHADHLRQGIGSAMIKLGIEKGKEMGFKGIIVEGNFRFYNTVGFRVVSTIPEQGVIATDGSRKIYIKTDRLYVDDCALMSGLYTCRGRATIIKPSGEQMVLLAYDEVDQAIGDKRMGQLRKQWAKEELERKKIEEVARLEREKQALALKAEQDRTAAELARIKAENDRKMEALRIEQEKKKEAERVAQEQKEAEEAAKRYPQEQKHRQEYAAAKLKAVSFDWESTILMSRTAKKNLVSCQLNEHLWSDLKTLITRGEWLASLSAIEGVALEDFPDSQRIDKIISILMDKVFHIEMNFTSSRDCYRVFPYVFTEEQEKGLPPKKVPVGYRDAWRDFNSEDIAEFSKNNWMLDRRPGVLSKGGYRHDFQLIIEFRIGDQFKTLLFDNDDNHNERRYKLTDEIYVGYVSRIFGNAVAKIKESLNAGRIDSQKAKCLIGENYKKSMEMIAAEVKPFSKPVSQLESIKRVDAKTVKTKKSVVCPACQGAKKKAVKKDGKIGFEKCERCCGTGRILVDE